MLARPPLRDRQSEPAATWIARTRGIRSVESIENMREVRRTNTDAVVSYDDGGVRPFSTDRHRNVSGRGRVLERVIDQIQEELPESILIPSDQGGLDLDHLETLAAREMPRLAKDVEH